MIYEKNLEKTEVETVHCGNSKLYICGTNLVFEDTLYSSLVDTFANLCKVFGENEDTEFSDEISDIKDLVLDKFLSHFGAKIETVCDEY